MTEKKELPSITNQDLKEMKIKPKIEEIITACLDGEMEEVALDFVDYLRANKMSPTVISINSWKSSFKGKGICYVKFDNEKWIVIPLLDHLNQYREMVTNEGMENIIWDNVFHCVNCNPRCAPGKNRTVLGKEFTNNCYGRPPFIFNNPNETTIDCIKRLLDMERKARGEGHKIPFAHFRYYNDI